MKTFTLPRIRRTADATFGELHDDTGALIARVAELPWLDNRPNVSCIPAGTYRAIRRFSPEHAMQLFTLVDVPGRGDIEIHIGCIPLRDSKGCLLLGTTFGFVDYGDNRPHSHGDGVLGSGTAFKRFMNLLDGIDEIELTITDPPPVLA